MEKLKLPAAFLLGALLAGMLTFYFVRPQSVAPQTAPERPEIAGTGNTSVSYIPKAAPEDADAQITARVPEIKVRYNDKAYSLPGISGEQHKFDQGKLTVETKTEAALDVTGLVSQLAEAKRPRQAIGIWQTSKGPAVSYGYFIAKNKKLTVMTTMPDVKKYAAVGLEITF